MHNISEQNGIAEMFSGNGVTPWHKLGTVVAGLLKARDAIKAAHLEWKCKGMPVTVNGIEYPMTRFQGIVREDTGKLLGMVGGRYTIAQNEECFEFMDALAGSRQISYETAGALGDGERVWMMAKVGTFEINGDKHEQWLLLVNNHDGSGCLTVQWVTVRVVCQNTLSAAMSTMRNQVRIRHTANWKDRAKQAQQVLGLTEDYFAKMRETLSGLNQQPMTRDDMDAFTKLLIPATDEKEVHGRTQNQRDAILARFNVPSAGTIGQSRWDALNAVTDYADHFATLRKSTSRLESSVLNSGTGSALKQKAVELLTAQDFTAQLISARAHTLQASPVTPTASGEDFARLLNQ